MPHQWYTNYHEPFAENIKQKFMFPIQIEMMSYKEWHVACVLYILMRVIDAGLNISNMEIIGGCVSD